jgi:sulfhydrogenase subunit gamma (sulfur reductase)
MSRLVNFPSALPSVARVVERIQESPTIFTLRLCFTDPAQQAAYRFSPGQFNMLSLYGVGEVPISVVSDPDDAQLFDHTIRALGRVTRGLAALQAGDLLGIRGPYGHGWPLAQAEAKDVAIISGGLGCAPTVAAINYILRRRGRYGRLTVVQGVKHSEDLLWRERYQMWANAPDTQVLIAANQAGPLWPWHVGHATELLDRIEVDPDRTLAMLCGPEGMMLAGVEHLRGRRVPAEAIWLSLERSMHCALGHCGHCQFGPKFVCQDGPVFRYADIQPLLNVRGL